MTAAAPTPPGALPAPPPALQQAFGHSVAALGSAPLAVAFSGGPDSVALAATAAWWATQPGQAPDRIELWHVHHGLLAAADAWASQVPQWAAVLQVPWRVQRVSVAAAAQHQLGVEAAARAARRQAFQSLQRASGCCHLLLAQHQDDQAETVLFRLLRGAGPGGLAAMRPQARLGQLTLLRPWLDLPRHTLFDYAQQVAHATGLTLARDPSNHDPRHARGWLRQKVMPAIAGYWPGYRHTLSRHARQAAELQDWLDDLVADDLARLAPDPYTLDRVAWCALPATRARLVLRAWLQAQELGPPTAARLAELERQLQTAAADRQLRWVHDGVTFGVYGQRLQRLPASAWQPPADHLQRWQHEPAWSLAMGTLRFESVAHGICPAWLAAAPLRLSWQPQGGRLRLVPNQPSRSLKAWFQAYAVAPWWRERAMRLWQGNQLVYVAGLGSSLDVPQASPGIGLHWHADASTR